MRNYTRFIPGEEIGAVEQWSFGAIDTAAQVRAAQAKVRESEQEDAHLESVRQESHQEGYAAGVAQGRAQAEVELQQQMADFLDNQAKAFAQHFSDLFDKTQSQLMQAQQTMAQGVLELSCELARQVMRQELSVNPNVLLPVIREALDCGGVGWHGG
jgi:flagellar assembly protein FliH